MSTTDKLAQAPEWMRDRAKVEELATYLESIGWRPDSMGEAECCDQAAAMSADVLRNVLLPMIDASQSTPAGEVTADAVEVALEAFHDDCGPDGSMTLFSSKMQAALAAAFPALVQQVERLKGSLSQWVLRVQSEENKRLRPDANRIEAIAAEYLHVVPFDMPTGQGDADVGWEVRQNFGRECVVIVRHYKDDVRAALDEAVRVMGNFPNAGADMRKAESREAAQSMFDDIYDTAATAQAKQAEGGK